MSIRHRILLVDGMALLFRGFFATAFRGNFMRTTKGVPTNGIYQFLRYFMDAVDTFEPSHIMCCWDMGSKTFRTELYAPYKKKRMEPPEELIPQFEIIKDVMESFGIPNIGLENYEADDCIGTLASYHAPDHHITILTGDQDILQLVGDGVDVAIMRKGQGNYEVFNQDNFLEKKGISPPQIIDLKGLMGDSADNFPGVKGIGEKTAMKLLTEYETIENVLDNIDCLPPGLRQKITDKITDNEEMLHLSRNLATIRCDIPIMCHIDDARWDIDHERAEGKLLELEFKNTEEWLHATHH